MKILNIMKRFRALPAIALAGVLVVLSACGDDDYFVVNRQIDVITREEGSGTRDAFIEILGIRREVNGTVRDMTFPEADVAPGTSAVISSVSGNFYAVGYISLGSLNNTVRGVPINGVPATPANVINGSYPLFRGFHIAYGDNLNALAQDFIDFMLSADGQEIVTNNGFVTVDQNPPVFTGGGLTGTINVNGSTSVFSIMSRLAEAYENANPGATVNVHSTGSSAGITATINGLADIGMTSRDLTATELTQVNYRSIAFDGLVVIVNNENPLPSLSPEEVRLIFEGERTRWSDFIS